MTDGPADAPLPPIQRTSLAAMVQRLFRRFAGHEGPDLPLGPLDARWRLVLGLPQGANLYAAMADVQRALDRLALQVEALPPSHHRTQARGRDVLDNLRHAISPQMFPRDWNQVASLVTNERLDRLDMLVDTLEMLAPEGIPPEGTIPELLSQVDDIEMAIQASPFPPQVRLALQGRLEALRWAIANWHLLGGDSVSDAAGALSAALMMEFSRAEQHDETSKEAARGLFLNTLKVVDWIGRYTVVRDVATNAGNLLAQAAPGLLATLKG